MECTPLNISVVLAATGAVRSNLATNQAASFAGLPEDSLYKRFLPDIFARMQVSQGVGSMPTREYARQLVARTLVAKPPRYVLLGGNAWVYVILQWLPRSFVLWVAWRIFSRLSRSG